MLQQKKRVPMKKLLVRNKGFGKGAVVYNLLANIDVKTIVAAGHGPPGAPEMRQFMNNYPKAKIYCFEPDMRYWEELVKKYEGTNVIMSPYALGDEDGEREFYETPTSGTSSILPYAKSSHNCYYVPSTTLDYFARMNNLQRINHLFLDVQGAEHLAFMGAKELLEKHAIDVIIGEAVIDDMYGTPDSFYDSYTLLKDAGYIFVGIYGPLQYPTGRVSSFDYIFARPELVKSWS